MSLLRAEQVSVSFGGVNAVNDVSLECETGSIIGIIGPNGAGKTTLIDALSGFVASAGHVWFEDRRIDGLAPHQRARRGLVRTFQSLELFDDLTVRDNLLASASAPRWWSALADLAGLRTRRADTGIVQQAMSLVGIANLAEARPGEVSMGERKRITVARALALSPKLIMLDEPAAGLDTDESRDLGSHLRRIAESGLTVMLVDHDMALVLGTADYVYVLSAGRLLRAGTPAQVRADPLVIEAYLGVPASAGGATAQLSPGNGSAS